jgi:hypothetical protein
LEYLADQVKTEAAKLEGYWSGRAVKYHRARIRVELGFREATLEDERRMVGCVRSSSTSAVCVRICWRGFARSRIEPPVSAYLGCTLHRGLRHVTA